MSSTLGIKTGSLVRQSLSGRCLQALLTSTRAKSSGPGLSRFIKATPSSARCSTPSLVVRTASTAGSNPPATSSSVEKDLSAINNDAKELAAYIMKYAKVSTELQQQELKKLIGTIENEDQLGKVLDKLEVQPKLKECMLKEYRDLQQGLILDVSPDFKAQMVRVQVLNDMYYGALRDTKNFPIWPIPETPPPVRFLFIPETWYNKLVSKTGVLGPHLLLGGFLGTLLSKELLVTDKIVFEAICFYIFMNLLLRILRNIGFAEFLYKQNEEANQDLYYKPIADAKAKLQSGIQTCEATKFAYEAKKYVSDVEKEFLELQMEAIYRERMQKVYKDVKARLDYQVEVQNARRRFEQEHMVNWITSNVLKSITPQQEKQSLAECISTLKRLSQTKATA